MTKNFKESMKQNSWFFEKMNKIGKPLAKLTKKRKTKINKIRDEKGDITINNNEIHNIIRECFKNIF
jgi:hypothetical protein